MNASPAAVASPPPMSSAPGLSSAVTLEVPAQSIEALAIHLVTSAGAHNFREASRDFDDTMKGALPPQGFAAIWSSLEERLGPFRAVERIALHAERGLHVAYVVSQFEKDSVAIKVVFDRTEHVAGLFIVPAESAWLPPAYVDPGAFSEQHVVVGQAPALPGTLTRPKTEQLVPGVVLIHGSGPSDEDETVGAVKVFKDLALGLASRQIAVLRYVKRSRQAPLGIITQKEEVLDGAHAAIALLRATQGIDPSKIFVLGHSQGGALAPRIAREEPGLAGIVVLAGPTRPVQDSLLAQLEYLAKVSGNAAHFTAPLDAARRFKQIAEDPHLTADQDVLIPGGGTIKGAYLLDARGYDPPASAHALACAVLVLQGERDYQVSMTEYDRWVRILAGQPRVTFRSYPSLNHLFVSGAGPSTPSEYQQPGHVDRQVIEEIAQWIASSAD